MISSVLHNFHKANFWQYNACKKSIAILVHNLGIGVWGVHFGISLTSIWPFQMNGRTFWNVLAKVIAVMLNFKKVQLVLWNFGFGHLTGDRLWLGQVSQKFFSSEVLIVNTLHGKHEMVRGFFSPTSSNSFSCLWCSAWYDVL